MINRKRTQRKSEMTMENSPTTPYDMTQLLNTPSLVHPPEDNSANDLRLLINQNELLERNSSDMSNYKTPDRSLSEKSNMDSFTLSDLSEEDRDNIRFTKCFRRILSNGTAINDCVFDKDKMIKEYSTKEISNIIFQEMDKSLRTIVEPLSASKQCKKTIGECGDPCICWLCGNPITSSSKMHCDHILPIIRAIMLTAIKSTNKVEKRIEFNQQKLKSYLDMTYNYAHDICNIKKSNRLLIRFETDKIVHDENECRDLAELIYNSIPSKSLNAEQKQIWIENKTREYIQKIENLLVPLNKEIKTILTIKGATMETYWRYTIEIIKSYASENALKNLKTNNEQLRENLNTHKKNALSALADYRSNMYKNNYKSITKKLDFRSAMKVPKTQNTKKRRHSTGSLVEKNSKSMNANKKVRV